MLYEEFRVAAIAGPLVELHCLDEGEAHAVPLMYKL